MDTLSARQVTKTYEGKVPHRALRGVDFSVPKGQFVAVMGPSGSGKTTLLNIIATIDRPTTGSVEIEGESPHTLDPEQLALFRRRRIGFVFQDHNLLDTLTIRENILLPLALDGVAPEEMNALMEPIADLLDLRPILEKRTYEVSGGQLQRAAIARAVIRRPTLLLADEPTGSLDTKASMDVMRLFRTVNREVGTTILMVTHDPTAASFADRVIFLRDGEVYHQLYRGAVSPGAASPCDSSLAAGAHRDAQGGFYARIMDVLAFFGGDVRDIQGIRPSQPSAGR